MLFQVWLSLLFNVFMPNHVFQCFRPLDIIYVSTSKINLFRMLLIYFISSFSQNCLSRLLKFVVYYTKVTVSKRWLQLLLLLQNAYTTSIRYVIHLIYYMPHVCISILLLIFYRFTPCTFLGIINITVIWLCWALFCDLFWLRSQFQTFDCCCWKILILMLLLLWFISPFKNITHLLYLVLNIYADFDLSNAVDLPVIWVFCSLIYYFVPLISMFSEYASCTLCHIFCYLCLVQNFPIPITSLFPVLLNSQKYKFFVSLF